MSRNEKLEIGDGASPLELLERLADPVVLLRSDGRIRFLNEAAEELFGRSWDALVGEPFRHERLTERSTEIEIERPDGSRVVAELRQSIVHWDGGEHRLISLRDVSRRREIENTLAMAKARYELATLGSNDGLWDWDLQLDEMYYSPRWKQLLGYEDHEVRNDKSEWLQRVHPEDVERLNADLYSHFHGYSRRFQVEHRLLQKDGSYQWFLATGSALRGFDGRAIRIAGSLTNIQSRKQFEENITFVAYHDPLTGLPNRGCCVQRLEEVLAKSSRKRDHRYAVLFIDVDGLKQVNDTFGHDRGDELLVEVASRLKRSIRVGDLAGRLGGDEFVVILDDIAEESDALRVADRIERELEAPCPEVDSDLKLSASIGIALARADYQHPDQVLRDADQAMYVAKKTGKGRSVIFDREAHREACAVLAVEKEVRQALTNGGLSVHFQPILERRERRPVAFEALLRWDHEERGLLLPGAFLPSIRDPALSRELDAWVLRRSCQVAVGMRDAMGQGPVLHVNLSTHSWNDPGWVSNLRRILDLTGLPPELLRIEVMESCLTDGEETHRLLDQLHSLGVGVVVDDCRGVTLALTLLEHPAIHGLKLGRDLVASLTARAGLSRLVRGLLNVAAAFDLPAITSGIEEEWLVDALAEEGCGMLQGFLFSGALPADEALEFWRGTAPYRNGKATHPSVGR